MRQLLYWHTFADTVIADTAVHELSIAGACSKLKAAVHELDQFDCSRSESPWQAGSWLCTSSGKALSQSTSRSAARSTTWLNTARHRSTTWLNTARHSMARHGTARHGTAQHSTAQHSTAQHSPEQHSTIKARDCHAEHATFRWAEEIAVPLKCHQLCAQHTQPSEKTDLRPSKLASSLHTPA